MERGNKGLITNEKAITSKDEDLLNFYPFAEKVQKVIQGYSNNPEPLTIGVYGKWGTGKTSFLNLVEKHIELFQKDKKDKPYIKFHYNPWIYQSKEEMLFDFFESLHRKLIYSGDSNLVKAGRFIKKYSRYLKAVKLSTTVGIPKIFNKGITIEPYEILKRLGEDLEGEEKSLDELKNQIDNVLEESDKKIVIFIDDVDRLDKDEIFTLFKLIKVNADFKNLIFIICLDDGYVAKAIYKRYGKNKKAGKDFIEKIINIPIELPLVEDYDLDNFLKQKIKNVFENKSKTLNYKQADYEELVTSLDISYFDSPREIIRIINSFAVSFYAIGNEVNIHDLFWIELIKIKYSTVYKKIKSYTKSLDSRLFLGQTITFKSIMGEDDLRKDFEDNHKEAYPVIKLLFPFPDVKNGIAVLNDAVVKPLNVLDSELRINHRNHFEKYFSFHTKGKISELSFGEFRMMIDENKCNEALTLIEEMIESANEQKVVYRLKSELQSTEQASMKKYINFLIDNIKQFSKISNVNPHSIELIRAIAEKLKQHPNENKDLIYQIIKKLDYVQLTWFLEALMYRTSIEYLDDINKELINKIKNSDKHPFFKNKNIARMVMEIWAKIEPKELEKYILDHLNYKENIFSFFRCFASIWNGSIQGMFKNEDLKYIIDVLKLDSKLLFEKVKMHMPEIDNLTRLEKLEWDEYSNNSDLDNVNQFAFLYLQEEKQQEINDSIQNNTIPPPNTLP